MDLSLFLSFPGILIVVGIVLLIIAIIIGIIAYKTVDSDEDIIENNKEEESEFEEEKASFAPVSLEDVEEPSFTKEDLLANTVILPNHVEEQEGLVEQSPVIEEESNEVEKKESIASFEPSLAVLPQEVTVEDDHDIDLLLDEFTNESNEEFIELATQKKVEPELESVSTMVNSYVDQEEEFPEASFEPEIKQEEVALDTVSHPEENVESFEEKDVASERPIYGGAKPLDHVDLHFDDDVRKPAYQERFQTMEIPILREDTKEEEEEEIELL